MLTLTTIPSLKSLPENLQKLELFLFDMDGTLLNTEFIHALSIESLIAGKIEAKVLMDRFKGMSDKAVFAILARELNLKMDAAQVIEQKNQELLKIMDALTKKEITTIFPPEMENFINDIKSSGKKIALVTASESVIADALLKKLNLTDKLNLIVTYQTTHQSKPNPSPYLYAMRFFEKHANECLIFEDSVTGLEAATLSGAEVVKASWFLS